MLQIPQKKTEKAQNCLKWVEIAYYDAIFSQLDDTKFFYPKLFQNSQQT